jgi:predicted nucleotide-binding protein
MDRKNLANEPPPMKKEVFIAHGKDLKPLNELKDILAKAGLTPAVLSEQPSAGMTIIEKLEAYSDVG